MADKPHTSTVTWSNDRPLTLDDIKAMKAWLDGVSPRHEFVSSRDFPKDHAWKVTDDGVIYVLAHPEFWMKFSAKHASPESNLVGFEVPSFGLSSFTIFNLDLPGEAVAASRKRIMAALRRALEAALHQHREPFDG